MTEFFINQLLHDKNQQTMQQVKTLLVKDKRRIFAMLRKQDKQMHSSNVIFPHHQCITLGEFCVGHLLQTDTKRKSSKSSSSSTS